MATVRVYLDFISPYAYFGWRNVRTLANERDLTLDVRPVVFAALLDHHGQLGPAEIPAKRVWTFKHIVRYAMLRGIPLVGPATHPFRTLTALRIAALPADPETQHRRVDDLFDAIWGTGGIDGGDDDVIAAALTERGHDGAALVEAAKAPESKARLKDLTAEAIEAGVFGVPTFVVGDELFWGNDSLEYVALNLDGEDPLDGVVVDRFLSRPRGADRRR